MDGTFLYGQTLSTEQDAITPAAGNALNGKVGGFTFYNTTAVALAVGGTSSVPVLYNPVNSNYNCRIMAVRYGVTAGTWAQGTVGYGITPNAVLSSLTAGPAAMPAYVGGVQLACPFLWYTTCTSGAAPTYFRASGINTGGAAAAGPMFNATDYINGFVVLAPGTAFYPAVSLNAVATTVTVYVDVIATLLGI